MRKKGQKGGYGLLSLFMPKSQKKKIFFKQKGGSTVYAPELRSYLGFPQYGIQRGEGLKKRQRGTKRQGGGVLKKRQRGVKKRGFGGLLAIGSLLAGLM